MCVVFYTYKTFCNPYSQTWPKPDKIPKAATGAAATATSARQQITEEIGNKYIFNG